jgi:hypothetical protein
MSKQIALLDNKKIARHEVVQTFLDLFENPSYLEIGVSEGVTFHNLVAATKVAVDPRFKIEPHKRELHSEYREITSDAFFLDHANEDRVFDVIYLDGLHTFEQVLRDFINALSFLRDGGIIIIDDVRPNNYQASLSSPELSDAVRRALRSEDRSWMGDVYRLVFFIETFFPLYSYATVSENHGQLVLWKGWREEKEKPRRTVREIAGLDFSDVIRSGTVYNRMPLQNIVELVNRTRRRKTDLY